MVSSLVKFNREQRLGVNTYVQSQRPKHSVYLPEYGILSLLILQTRSLMVAIMKSVISCIPGI